MTFIQTASDCVISDGDSFPESLKRDILHPSRIFTPFVVRFLLSFFLAVVTVFAVLRSVSTVSALSTAILWFVYYIFLSNMTGSNMIGSLPYATYPIPPHLGRDGISVTNRSRYSR